MIKRNALAIAFFTLFLAGCGMQPVSDESLRANTAGVLGVSSSEVTISDRTTQAMNTYYIAKMKSGQEYACVFETGDVYTGMGDPPQCHKKDEPSRLPFLR
jgi:hypothetical protein